MMSHQIDLGVASKKIDMIAQHLKDHFEDKGQDADNSGLPLSSIRRRVVSYQLADLLSKLEPLHDARWDRLIVDSSSEEPHAEIVDDIYAWAQSSSDESVLWLTGAVGNPKTLLAHHVCQQLSEFKVLAASFFVQAGSAPAHDALKIVHSIAYQLAVHDRGMARVICAAMRNIPDLLTRQLHVQITHLIAEPVGGHQGELPLVLVLDSLDDYRRGRAGTELLELLVGAVAPALGKGRLLITSRSSIATDAVYDAVISSAPRVRVKRVILERSSSPVPPPSVPLQSSTDSCRAEDSVSPVGQQRRQTSPNTEPVSMPCGDVSSTGKPHYTLPPNFKHGALTGSLPPSPAAVLLVSSPSGSSQDAVPVHFRYVRLYFIAFCPCSLNDLR
jgi:hypothetical protein